MSNKEYIDRETAVNAFYTATGDGDKAEWCVGVIESLPAADVRPVARGRDTGSARIFSCSECGYGIEDIFLSNEEDYSTRPNFCPNCGARMEES